MPPIAPSNDDPLYELLIDSNIREFNERRAAGASCNLQSADFRGMDLRNLDARGLDLRGAYFRNADLRGIDFSTAELEGASIKGAKISGAWFPARISAEELTLSLVHGTRIRYLP